MQVNLSSIIGQWRPIAARLTEWNRAVPAFEHLFTLHAPDTESDGCSHGHVIWGSLDSAKPMAMCWEWAEVKRGVVAIFNPMNVLSNVRLMTEDGQPFTFGQSVLAFNTVVHEIDWQSQVSSELRFRRMAAKSVVSMNPRGRSNAPRPVRSLMSAQALAA